MSRLLVYVHYNKYNVVSEYIYYQLKSIRSIYSDIVFVSNSHVSKDIVQYLQSERLIDFLSKEIILVMILRHGKKG